MKAKYTEELSVGLDKSFIRKVVADIGKGDLAWLQQVIENSLDAISHSAASQKRKIYACN